METLLFTNIKKLYDNELYSSVIPVASLLSTLYKNDRSIGTPELEYQVLLFRANAHYMEHQYRIAANLLDAALLQRKTIVRLKNSPISAIELLNENFKEDEIRYRLAICYRELNEHHAAVLVLQVIPTKARTPKISMLLAKLLHLGRAANTNEAIVSYKDILRECPLALDAIDALLELGVDGIEVNSLVVNASAVSKHIDWLSLWIKGHAQMYNRKHLEASKSFQSINDTTQFHQNEHILTLIGKTLYYYGSFPQAQQFLESAIMKNPHNMEAIAPLAVVYEYNQKLQELEKLASRMNNINEFGSEHWFVLSESFYATGKMEKASSFTHKAISVNPRNVEAQLLRGKICLQMKRHEDGIYFFRSAQCIANYRFEVYKGLFHCYVGLQRLKEAQTMCTQAVRYFKNSPRSYVMFARTFFHSTNPVARRNARKFASKALEIDEYFSPAVALMAEICQGEGKTQEAINLLKKQLVHFPNYKLFTMLGDILATQKDFTSALEYYTIALNMEPTYQRALQGVNALGEQSRFATEQEHEISMAPVAPDDDWPIANESNAEQTQLSSPAVVGTNEGESDTFSDPFWQDVDNEEQAT